MLEGLLRPQHILVILLVAFFVFGGKKLPEIASGMGKAVREFKCATTEPEPPAGPDHALPSPSPTDATTDPAAHTRG